MHFKVAAMKRWSVVFCDLTRCSSVGIINVSEQDIASIFNVEVKIKTIFSSKTFVTIYKPTWYGNS
jgi:hypothetical protein